LADRFHKLAPRIRLFHAVPPLRLTRPNLGSLDAAAAELVELSPIHRAAPPGRSRSTPRRRPGPRPPPPRTRPSRPALFHRGWRGRSRSPPARRRRRADRSQGGRRSPAPVGLPPPRRPRG